MKKNICLVVAIITAILATGFTGCKKKDKKEAPVIIISPNQLHILGNVGDVVAFKITVNTNARLSKFIIKAAAQNQPPSTLLDTSITTVGTVFYYYYTFPENQAGKSITMSFRAEDQNGMSNEDYRVVFINPLPTVKPITLTETAGHTMYRYRSNKFDAYNLETNGGEYSILSDSTARDIQDFSDTANATLSRSWKSPAGGKFVHFVSGSGFDYANATDSSTIGAYTAGLKTSLLTNLKIGDVILSKLGSTSSNKYVVIRITNVVDVEGKNEDYYEFSIKK